MNKQEKLILKTAKVIQVKQNLLAKYQTDLDVAELRTEIALTLQGLVDKKIKVLTAVDPEKFVPREDLLTLVSRLYDEDDRSFSSETYEVMKRWRPIFKSLFLRDETNEK